MGKSVIDKQKKLSYLQIDKIAEALMQLQL